MVMGPAIDPPYPQSDTRPCGVYHYPDRRVGCLGRTVYEIWSPSGECIACSSVAESGRLMLEPRLWEFLDMVTDVGAARHRATLPSGAFRVLR